MTTDFDAETETFKESFEGERVRVLPDENVVRLGNQRFRCPEALFDPSTIDKGTPGCTKASSTAS